MDFGGADGSNGTATGYARARAARELYQAQLAKMEVDRQRGILVRADEVKVGAFNMARKARDQLIALPERVAAKEDLWAGPAAIASATRPGVLPRAPQVEVSTQVALL